MAWGEGIIWEPGDGNGSTATASGAVNVEVAVQGSEIVGVVQIEINDGQTFESIAQELATEWNARKPLNLYGPQLHGNVVAVPNGRTTKFFPTGDLADEDSGGQPLHPVVQMGLTFPEQIRKPLPAINSSEVWQAGNTKATRVLV